MKQSRLPDYPVMYKSGLAAGECNAFRYDDFLFIYVCSGSGSLYTDGEEFPIGKGSCRIMARNERITLQAQSEMQLVFIRISEDAVADFLLHNPASSAGKETCNSISVSNHLLLQSLIPGIEAGLNNGYRANISLTCIKVQECLNMLAYICPGLPHWLYDRNSLSKISLKEFMETHYRENLPFEQFAQATGRSLSTFRRDFLREFKTTPGKWILTKRLQEAYRLITQKGLKPSAFLMELGFESFSHFSRSFKAHFGILPSALLREGTATA